MNLAQQELGLLPASTNVHSGQSQDNDYPGKGRGLRFVKQLGWVIQVVLAVVDQAVELDASLLQGPLDIDIKVGGVTGLEDPSFGEEGNYPEDVKRECESGGGGRGGEGEDPQDFTCECHWALQSQGSGTPHRNLFPAWSQSSIKEEEES